MKILEVIFFKIIVIKSTYLISTEIEFSKMTKKLEPFSENTVEVIAA